MTEAGDIHASQPGVAAKYLRTAQVAFPDGIVRYFRIHKNAEGQILFDLATDYVLLAPSAKGYLALIYSDRKGQPRFVRNDVALGKQVAAKYWSFVLSFKFYVTEPAQLSDGVCRHYMLQQCRRDVNLGRIPTDLVTQASLAGYVAQMKLGDFQQPANYAKYYANVMSSERLKDEGFVAAVRELHRSLSGQTPQQAELAYLNCCKQLPLYGCHRVMTKDGKLMSPFQLAVSAPGLSTYEEGEGITSTYPWYIIEKVSFRRKFFCIKFLKNLPEQPALDGQTVVYKLDSTSVAERFYKLVIEHHTFFRLTKPSPKRKSKGFFQWASRLFRTKTSEATQSKAPTDNDETVMTVRLDETIEKDDDETASNISAMLDRTQFSDEEGSVYTVESKEIDHDHELSQAILEATKLNPHVAVECLGSEM